MLQGDALIVAPFVAPITLDLRWNRVSGIEVNVDGVVTIDPVAYFFTFERPEWRIIGWDLVVSSWALLKETRDQSLEQVCLAFIKRYSQVTTDPGSVLANAEKVFAYLFTSERLRLASLPALSDDAVQAMREAATLNALNRVDSDGHIANCGPAWMLADVAQMVYGFDDATMQALDDQLHAEHYTEVLRVDALRAHTALCGRPIHACRPGTGNGGKAVLEYGTDVTAMQNELEAQRVAWRTAIDDMGKHTELV